MNKILLQTAIAPYFVYQEIERPFFKTFVHPKEAIGIVASLSLTKDHLIYVNRGPGSYSGIRISLALAFGLVQGGMIDTKQLFTYTSFELFAPYVQEGKGMLIKSWPKVGGDFLQLKGYYQQMKTTEQSFKTIAELSGENAIICDSPIQNVPPEANVLYTSDLLIESYITKFATTLTGSSDWHPLYINPVHFGA